MHEHDDHGRTQAVDNNPYAPPSARIADHGFAASPAEFYVVAPAKAAILMVATFGFYALYWFWRHWTLHKIARKLDIWPVPRAIFSIFCAHSLFKEFDYRIVRSGQRHRWSPGGWATLYVVAAIGGRILDRLPETAISLNASVALLIAMLFALALSLYHAQRAANIACGDPDAVANRRMTLANYVWLGLGGLWWALVALGTMLPEEPMQ